MYYTILSYKLKAYNFTLLKLKDGQIILIKNENGTYSEFYDFEIDIKFDENTKYILDYKLTLQNIEDENYLGSIKNILVKSIKNKTTLENLCEQLCF
jgi:hypothetical protein